MNKQPYLIIEESLRCPVCGSNLMKDHEQILCQNRGCGETYPIVRGVPVLINQSSSLFSFEDFIQEKKTTFQEVTPTRKKIARILPTNSNNLVAKENYLKFKKLITERANLQGSYDVNSSHEVNIPGDGSARVNTPKPKILVIGGSILGEGIETLINDPQLDITEGDVTFGPRTQIIFDAHDLPFKNSSFQGVIIQAVLEHVVDPYKCVDEIYRVLEEGGIVYAETPFMQQVHMGCYDFTRFTHLGHRRLFRQFQEIQSGPTGGPGMGLAWSYQYFLLTFVQGDLSKDFIRAFARLTSFWLKYFDKYLIKKPGAWDAAFGYYFLGSKVKKILTDNELIQGYSGAQI